MPFALRTGLIFLIALTTFQLAIAIHAAIVAVRQVKSGSVPKHTWRSFALGMALLALVVFAHRGSPDRLFPVRPFQIASKAMSPTLVDGDRIIADMGYYKTHRPDRGDVILFTEPTHNQLYTKRVIAIAGDTIEGSPGSTILNGHSLSEPYAIHDPNEVPYDAETFGPITIPPYQMFVMRDNRDDSANSREFGPVDITRITGKALYIYYSRYDKSRIGRPIR